MDPKIFKDFEDLIQHQSDFIINNYGQPAYDVCCSVRDWFETCLKHIQPLFKEERYSPTGLEVYIDIVIADIFQKGVKVLLEKFFWKNTYNQKSSTNFFPSRQEESDDLHLKKLRAVFGAHPFDIKHKGEDLGCVLYIGDSPLWLGESKAMISHPGREIKSISLNSNGLKQFIMHRYSLLADVIQKIKSDIAGFIETMKKTPIGITDAMSPLEKLDILHEEAGKDKRGKIGDEFQVEVEQLRNMFACDITSPQNKAMVETYRKALLSIIEKYRKILKNMSFAEAWEEEPLLEASALGLPDKYNWDIQNLRIKSPKSPIAENCLKNLFHSKFDTTYSSREEFYLLICAYLFTHPGKEETTSL